MRYYFVGLKTLPQIPKLVPPRECRTNGRTEHRTQCFGQQVSLFLAKQRWVELATELKPHQRGRLKLH